MKVYFEKFGGGYSVDYLTPYKLYEVYGAYRDTVIIRDDVGLKISIRIDGDDGHTLSSWKILPGETKMQSPADIVSSLESDGNNMKIYFEKFYEGREVSYLTPLKIYEVVGCSDGGDWAKIKDDQGDKIMVKISSPDQTYAPWKILPSVEDFASRESERNALANSIDSVNELLDSLSVPKAETLVKRVSVALDVGYKKEEHHLVRISFEHLGTHTTFCINDTVQSLDVRRVDGRLFIKVGRFDNSIVYYDYKLSRIQSEIREEYKCRTV